MTGPGTPRTARRPRGSARAVTFSVALTAFLALLCCAGGTVAVLVTEFADEADNPIAAAFGCGSDDPVQINGRVRRVGPYGDRQIRNAAEIIKAGQDLKVPPRGWVIALATAMQESALRNLANSTVPESLALPHEGVGRDHDSVGLFQQRPGWGTVAQRMTPSYSAGKFYGKLLTISGWQNLPLTIAAQRVQISAFPDAYAKHESNAAMMVNVLAKGAARAAGGSTQLRCTAPGEIAASGWTVPVPGAVGSGFRTAERPQHNGVDIGVAKGTPILATAAGRVLVARCDPDNRGRLTCNVDGYPGKGGCGWFVDILHAGGVITRYCHMVVRPKVRVNERVDAGQPIGWVGSSGNSSGPHLHFEVHLGADRSSRGAVDPATFMRERGAPLRAEG